MAIHYFFMGLKYVRDLCKVSLGMQKFRPNFGQKFLHAQKFKGNFQKKQKNEISKSKFFVQKFLQYGRNFYIFCKFEHWFITYFSPIKIHPIAKKLIKLKLGAKTRFLRNRENSSKNVFLTPTLMFISFFAI